MHRRHVLAARAGDWPVPCRRTLTTPSNQEVALRLDIVFPAHNEERRIGRTLSAYRAAFSHPLTRFHVAMDACTDGTARVAAAHRRRDPRVQVHDFPKLGKGGVLSEAFARADGDLVGFVDADGATPPAEFGRLVEAAGAEGGAIASRSHPASVLPAPRPLTRRVTSAGFALATRRLLRLPYSDTQCGAKVLRRDVADSVIPHLRLRDFLWDVDLLLTARERRQRIVEVPTVWVDQDGSRVDAIADARSMGRSLLRLWWESRRRAPAGPPVHTDRSPVVRTPTRREVAHAGA